MRRSVRSFLTPGWVGLTVFAWAAAAGMGWLGHWQLIVSDEKHFDLQNFGYALQWWAFSAFAIGFWGKLVHDARRGRQPSNESSGGLPVLRSGGGGALVGPAQLLATTDAGGDTPVVYRGYVMPQSATSPDRSDGDRMRASYNDYLWQLAMADSAPGTGRTPSSGADSNRTADSHRTADSARPADSPRPADARDAGPLGAGSAGAGPTGASLTAPPEIEPGAGG